jgi:RNase H-fold protein (predicted Holliday junction resolvase)
MIIGFDPGRDKCGLALVEMTGNILQHEVVTSEQVMTTIKSWLSEYKVKQIVMGNQNTSQQWREKLNVYFSEIPIKMVDERNTTLEARDRYWTYYPPNWLMRLVPKGMRIPPRPIDDIVAILLVERSRE